MSGPMAALSRAAGVMDALGSVDVLRVSLDHTWLTPASAARSVPVLVVAVHASDFAQAGQVVRLLGLSEGASRVEDGNDWHGPMLWRTWAGWVVGDGDEVPVSVTVTAAEPAAETDLPVPYALAGAA